MEESSNPNPTKKPRLEESDSSNRVCPFKHSSELSVPRKITRVEEPGCEIGTNGRTFQVLDEVAASDTDDDGGEGDSPSQEEEFGKS